MKVTNRKDFMANLEKNALRLSRFEFLMAFVASVTATKKGREFSDGRMVWASPRGKYTYGYAKGAMGPSRVKIEGPASADMLYDVVRRGPLIDVIRQGESLREEAFVRAGRA